VKWLLIIICALVVLAIAGSVYVRSAGHDPARWHVDPATVTDVNESNEYLASETFAASPQAVAGALKDALGGEVLAGNLSDGWATIVVRSALIGYPDYVSARISPAGDGSQVTLYSRSRYGLSDLGANKTRVEKVFATLKNASNS